MEYNDFITHLKCLAILPKSETKTHYYRVQEDLVAYYCAKHGIKDKEKLELLVMKMNRLDNSDLKYSSFSMRISNMSFSISGSGNAHNSEQGKSVATFCNKLYVNKKLDGMKLKEFINTFYKEQIL